MKYLLIAIMMVGTLTLNAQTRPTQTQQRTATKTTATKAKTTTQATTAKTFTLTNGKLGPVQVGKKFANIPATYSGLYDKYTRQTEKEYNEVEDYEMTIVCYQFTKGGKNVFCVIMEGNTIGAIKLQEGSASIVKTQKGFYVGYPARDLFSKRLTEWFNIEEGTAACFDGNYTYEVNADDRISINSIESANDFKPDAKISSITYHN